MYLETVDTVVYGDLHGEAGAFERAYDFYGNNVRHIPAGDFVDGDTPPELFDMLVETGARPTKGNHEIVLCRAMLEKDLAKREAFARDWLDKNPKYYPFEVNMLSSYKVPNEVRNLETGESRALTELAKADRLKTAIQQAGHLSLLTEAPLYIETDDFIVIHAGLTSSAWEEQRARLDDVQANMADGNYGDTPIQIFDRRERNHDGSSNMLARQSDGFSATKKTVITGHWHADLSASERVTANGRRVRLASHLSKGMPLYVWQSWDKKVVALS